ncbi:hypothetical protein [Methylobacterium oxalidis]|uniref:Uncharacterized protein n=1 Tax=Methylobacterium oxalidis TaxID=944322 RepID=A0A512J466_9HYPH|nr:hypothetical protein [Methylobacterium oxalidis]GEP04732.1 hypothetical protein MOX02_27700 [Methylobacterium oxalidis]GJE30432.1 hypothetical protein LDDCCGHA_0600 [Methylobacterium oxalidis]GLS63558.1 hypothetical protein GCM10007888_19390 [Methylobacterium oxalidis]
MPRSVTYRITDRPDGRFDVVVTLEATGADPVKTFLRDGVGTLAEAEAWVEGLRILMAAVGAPVARSEDAEAAVPEAALHRSDL